ncbi:hypothetical protein CGRA01v4_05794 [Colletotrichum graminicola]|nr:hypothetical protein CGRA01v4_05794 [Colletotrichum graminicola]
MQQARQSSTVLCRWMLRMTAPPWGVPFSCWPDYPSAITSLLGHELSPPQQIL